MERNGVIVVLARIKRCEKRVYQLWASTYGRNVVFYESDWDFPIYNMADVLRELVKARFVPEEQQGSAFNDPYERPVAIFMHYNVSCKKRPWVFDKLMLGQPADTVSDIVAYIQKQIPMHLVGNGNQKSDFI